MVRVSIICVGKLKESYLRDACAEYIKRLGAYCSLEVVELTPAKLPDNPSPALVTAALAEEAAMISKRLPPRAAVCAMCIEGETVTSDEFARRLEKLQFDSGCVAFVIGSSYGLDEGLKRSAGWRLSMSPMTFPHQLARVMLFEQLYRAFQISSGGKYHK